MAGALTPYYSDDAATLYLGDALDLLPELPIVDVVVADPPYTFGLASTKMETVAGSWGDLMNNARWYASWLREVRRVARGSAWIFSSWRTFPVLARACWDATWPISSLLVWDKGEGGPGDARIALTHTYELVAHLAGPAFRFAETDRDVWRVPRVATDRLHAAEKPVPLVERIIARTGARSLLDPFAGSGSSLVAAKLAGIPSVGVEIEERYAAIAARRLEQTVMGLDAPAIRAPDRLPLWPSPDLPAEPST